MGEYTYDYSQGWNRLTAPDGREIATFDPDQLESPSEVDCQLSDIVTELNRLHAEVEHHHTAFWNLLQTLASDHPTLGIDFPPDSTDWTTPQLIADLTDAQTKLSADRNHQHDKAFELGARVAKLENALRWRDPAKELPVVPEGEHFISVLTCCNGGRVVRDSFAKNGNWSDPYKPGTAFRWLPLPAPWKEGE